MPPDTKICLPLCLTDFSEIEETIGAYSNNFDTFEVWLDYVVDLDVGRLESLINKYPERLLLLFRRKNLEPIKMSISERKTLIDRFEDAPLFFDFDITVQVEELDYYSEKGRNSKLIASYHNYSDTPPVNEIETILSKMDAYNPDIIKVATYCNSNADAILLLEVLNNLKKSERNPIVLGMGEHGVITRCFGGEFGNVMTFVTQDENDEGTAPGQLSLGDLMIVQDIIERIKKDGR